MPDAAPVDAGAPVDAAPVGDGGAACDGSYEPNDSVATATEVSLDGIYISPSGDEGYVSVWMMSDLCSGDEDWYRIPASAFPLTPKDVRIRFLARDAGWCGPSCQDVVLLPAPENTVFVEIFDSAGTVLHKGLVSEIGDLDFYVGAPVGEGDFYLRIYGPAAAVYPYRLFISVSKLDGEDECEC